MQDLNYMTTTRKALNINLDERIYGTIAEIGAGQEVARHFFQAGKASGTIAKTISAYDMVFSDEIYGKEKSGRYVCESRLTKMLDHEFSLVQSRLKEKRGSNTTFFAFANTVTTSSVGGQHTCNGWMGIRFQKTANGPSNDIVLHVRMKDRFRLQQQEALGILGVNLIFCAFYPPMRSDDYVAQLIDNLGAERVEIDVLKFSGPDFKHVDNRLMSLQLVTQQVTSAVAFAPNTGEALHLPDILYKKNVFVSRGTFRPVTNANVDIIQQGFQQFCKDNKIAAHDAVVFAEITTHNLRNEGELDSKDFLDRVDTLAALGYYVLISDYDLFYQMKKHLRAYTPGRLGIVVGASHLPKLFDESFYKPLEGGILEGFGKLFDENTRIYVYPFKQETLCTTAKTFNPKANLAKLYQHLLENERIVDIVGCNEAQISLHSSDVRKLMGSNDKSWEKLVPSPVVQLIKSKKMFA